jgi:hypothetical protein
MRYLNKIIFVNSAKIRYAEISLNGNVHFIGTQGVGKSTLLRAILFIYNADTLGLGIPRQKASYTDYYFKEPNAYIIYEIVREDGKFCVVSYNSQHKVCFRFFDGEYKQEYFVNENGTVPSSWEGIAERLDRFKVFYTKRKIDEHKEYRDIFYGNNDGKKSELRRYSLIESKDYQYIPKTIQNVFLNSKMEAEFIKQTIIMSLDNDFRIDLNQHAHHLNGFESQLNDIRKFKTPSATAQADSISKLYIAINSLEREKIRLAKQLAWSLTQIEQLEPKLRSRLETQEGHKSVLEAQLKKISETFKTKETKLRAEISVHENNIKKAKQLNEDYNKINIDEIIIRVERKPTHEREQKALLQQRDLLTSQFKELEHKYQAVLDLLENQLKEFINSKESEKNQIQATSLSFRDETRKQYERQISELRNDNKSELEQARDLWEQKKQDTQQLKIYKEGIKHKRFFEEEIKNIDKEINTLNYEIKELSSENVNSNREIETFQKNWDIDDKEIQRNFDRDVEKVETQITELSQNIAEIASYIENSKSSLYGWLTINYPGWENTIGKVIKEDINVLFNTELSPKLLEKSSNFYGVEIDLSEITKTVKTVEDYEKDKEELNIKIEGLRKYISELNGKSEKDKENLKKKYQPKIRERKDLIKEYEYLIGQKQIKRDEAIVKLNEVKDNAENEKVLELQKIKLAIEESTKSELETKANVDKIEEELSRQIKSKESERDKKIRTEEERVQHLLINISTEVKSVEVNHQKRKSEINTQKQKELVEKGADTERLEEIEKQLTIITSELEYIEQKRDKVSDYRKDKREYIDKFEEFKNEKQKKEKELTIEQSKHQHQKSSKEKELEIVNHVVSNINKDLEAIQEDNEEFDHFRELSFYSSIQIYFSDFTEEHQTEKRVKLLINELNDIENQKLRTKKDELRTTVTDFLGKFNDDNVFKFKKQLTNDQSFLDFALMLSDFVEERKIERIEKEVNERFALIVSTIAQQTSSLVSNSGEIQKIINKINEDFEKKDFAGVIKKIELKIDESRNEIVQLLILIKKFNDENIMNIGKPNLFSDENQEKKNKVAIDLLKQFTKKIGELKRDIISLSDSFELKFKIIENDNDSGWVEKLTNVGSEGTDVLVKAMLNIMLLNVFKEGASKKFRDFQLHCMMDEIGKLHPNNVRGILKFAKDRNIWVISGSPIENDALAFDHIYKLSKDEKNITRVKRILTQYSES